MTAIRIEASQFADLIMPDRDFFSCAPDEIASITSDLTMVSGKVVYAAGDFARFDEGALPPPMPDWSPVRNLPGHGAVAENKEAPHAFRRQAALFCDCGKTCNVHGHDHASAWTSRLPVGDLQTFWGALGCSCWAV